MHIKRNKMPNAWPVPRKGKKSRYIAVPSHSLKKGVPLLFIIRDILKIAKTRKEARYLILKGDVKINNQIHKNELFPAQVFDVISFEKTGKNYRMEIINRKFKLKEISDKESEKKIIKIIGKRILGKNKIQMNLEDGQNCISKDKFSVGDSAVMNIKTNKIDKLLSLKEGADIEIISGKHAGKKGKLKAIEKLTRENVYVIKLKEGEITLPFKTILVIE